MAAFLARAASFLAQADSFHLLSISASGETPSGQPTSLVGLSNGVALVSALDGDDVVGEVEVVQLGGYGRRNDTYSHLLSLHASGGSVDEHLASESPKQPSYSLTIDDVHNGAELAEISSVADVGDTTNFNKTSENLGAD